MATIVQNRSRVALSLRHSPIIGVVRTASREEAVAQARMLAAGGFGVEEIPAYARAGASAFGLAAPLLGVGPDGEEARRRIARALALARGQDPAHP